MEQEIGNISIALIRKLNPAMKGIGNDFIMDSTEYYIPDVNSIFKYPLRLDGIIIAVRKQGSATININLREYNTTKNDLILCAPSINSQTGHASNPNVPHLIRFSKRDVYQPE